MSERMSFKFGKVNNITVNNTKIQNGDICFGQFEANSDYGTLAVKYNNKIFSLRPGSGEQGLPLLGNGLNKAPDYGVLPISGGGTGITSFDANKLYFYESNQGLTFSDHGITQDKLHVGNNQYIYDYPGSPIGNQIKFYVEGISYFNDQITVASDKLATFGGDVIIKKDLTAKGNINIVNQDNLSVEDAGNLSVDNEGNFGNITLINTKNNGDATNKELFSLIASNKAIFNNEVNITSSLTVDGIGTFSTDVQVTRNLTVDAQATLNNVYIPGTNVAQGGYSLQVVGDVDISGDLSVDGESHCIGGPLLLNGDLDTIGTVSIGGEMTIAEDLNTQDVYINGKKFQIASNTETIFQGSITVDVTGKFSTDVEIERYLTVNQTTWLNAGVYVGASLTANDLALYIQHGILKAYDDVIFEHTLQIEGSRLNQINSQDPALLVSNGETVLMGNFTVSGESSFLKYNLDVGENLSVGGFSEFLDHSYMDSLTICSIDDNRLRYLNFSDAGTPKFINLNTDGDFSGNESIAISFNVVDYSKEEDIGEVMNSCVSSVFTSTQILPGYIEGFTSDFLVEGKVWSLGSADYFWNEGYILELQGKSCQFNWSDTNSLDYSNGALTLNNGQFYIDYQFEENKWGWVGLSDYGQALSFTLDYSGENSVQLTTDEFLMQNKYGDWTSLTLWNFVMYGDGSGQVSMSPDGIALFDADMNTTFETNHNGTYTYTPLEIHDKIFLDDSTEGITYGTELPDPKTATVGQIFFRII